MYSPFDFFLMFVVAYFTVLLLGLQSKNVNQSRYAIAAVTSVGINAMNFIFIKYAVEGGWYAFMVTSVGASLGILSSIYIHDRLVRRQGEYSELQGHQATRQL